MNNASLSEILFDKKDNEKLYGIFDAALIKGLWVDIDTWSLDFSPLYRGDYEQIAEAIPYVIELNKEKDKLACEQLLESFGKNAILFIVSPLEIEALTKKMRFFYHAKTSSGEAALRRFYDPRVFPNFMKGMNGENRLAFFDGISEYFSEYEQGEKLLSYKKEGNELKRKEFSLAGEAKQ